MNKKPLRLPNDTMHYRKIEGIDQVTKDIEFWARERQLYFKDGLAQFVKVVEEVGEIAQGIARQDHDAVRDALGDTYITLVILGYQLGMPIEECIQGAFNEIKNRKGKTINGVFVKQSDLDARLGGELHQESEKTNKESLGEQPMGGLPLCSQ